MIGRKYELDLLSILLYLVLVVMGWVTIYAVASDGGELGMWEFGTEFGRQMIWIGISVVIGIVLLSLDSRLIEPVSYVAYGIGILVLLVTLIAGKEVNGAKAWLTFGSVSIQPAEFMKLATALALARYMGNPQFSVRNLKKLSIAAAIVLVPALIVILQNDTGSALVFGSLLIVFYREGLSPVFPILIILVIAIAVLTLWAGFFSVAIGILVITIFSFFSIVFFVRSSRKNWARLLIIHLLVGFAFTGFSYSVNYIVENVLATHQQNRIKTLFDDSIDPQGAGYNVIQSKTAIGSGGFFGKGFNQGSYTKYDFVPKQSTDFIFCTVGEEFGWVGTSLILIMMFILILRVFYLAENSKTRQARVYGYSVLSILAFHVMVNVGMTIGFVPVIGIPLPFFSYGGSSLLAFSIMLFILINFYSHRTSVLGSKV